MCLPVIFITFFAAFLVPIACLASPVELSYFPIQYHSILSYRVCPVVGELLMDTEMRELYWDEKHGYLRDTQLPPLTIRYDDTLTIGGTTFYKPTIVGDVNQPELSYLLHLTVGAIEDQIFAGESGVGSDRLERIFDVSRNLPAVQSVLVEHRYHVNLSGFLSRVIHAVLWLPHKAMALWVYARPQIYDDYTLILTTARFEHCRVFIFPQSFYIFCRGYGLVAMGNNTTRENDYYFLEKMKTDDQQPSAKQRTHVPSWRRKR